MSSVSQALVAAALFHVALFIIATLQLDALGLSGGLS